MMKRCVLFVVVFLLFVSFAVAQNGVPSVAGDNYEREKGEVDAAIAMLPIDEEGKADFSEYKPFYSKADARIDAINDWLDNNVAWLGPVFHMKPQISWVFAFNLYFILLFLLLFILNAEGIWFFFDEEKFARMFGGGLFVILLVGGFYAYLSNLLLSAMLALWNTLVVAGFWVALLVVALVIIVILLGGGSVLLFLKNSISLWMKRRKEKKGDEKEELNREALGNIVEAVNKS